MDDLIEQMDKLCAREGWGTCTFGPSGLRNVADEVEAEDRVNAERLVADHRTAAEARRRAFLAELDDCPDCDIRGWALDDDGTPAEPARRCPNHDWQTAHA